MKSRRRITWLLAALLFVAMSAGSVLAQDDSSLPYPDNAPAPAGAGAQNTQDPPGRVARLQYMSGEVSMQPGGVNEWVAASLNRPLTTSDRVWTDKNSRAELNVGDGFLRLNSQTSLTLTNVGDNTVQLELDQGILEVTVRHLERGEIYEVDTPNFAFTVMKPGVYRFDVYPNEDQSWVTVRNGYGEATGRGAAVRVNSGQQVRFGNANSLQHTAENAPARDGFDDWVQVRDKRLDSSVSARYVSPGVIGYQDLDGYGTWQTVPTYGAIWIPSTVPAGWAPYRYGHWVWIAPWGWTWVDDEPWGFAPFHYGRWVSYGGRWGWAPGPIGYWNPYYAPALVGWIGGAGFGVGFGWGGGWGVGFGWFPLGWGAPYYPRYCGWGHGGWYRGGGYVSNTYLRNVNVTNTRVTNITNITNNYYNNNLVGPNPNRNIPGAVTAAPKSAFTSGAAINRVGVAVPRGNLGNGQLVHTADVMPTRDSVVAGHSPARALPPVSATNRNVVTRATPPTGPARFNNAAQSAAPIPPGTPSANRNNNSGRMANTGPNENLGPAGRNVPRPPSAGGTVSNAPGGNAAANTPAPNVPRSAPNGNAEVGRSSTPSSAPSVHPVPRPPSGNDNVVRSNGGNVNSHPAGTGTQQGYTGGSNDHPAHSPAVPRPPADYTNHPPSGAANQSSPTYHTPAMTPHESAPQHQQAPPRESPNKSDSKNPGMASAPRPPAGYSYQPAPAYSPSAGYGATRSSGNPGGGNNHLSYPAAAPAYSAGRGSYSPAPNYNTGRNYSPAPAYASRNSAPVMSAPHYSAPPAPHYSSGGGGGYRAPSAPSGGSHGGGGGSSHSSGGSNGGKHN